MQNPGCYLRLLHLRIEPGIPNDKRSQGADYHGNGEQTLAALRASYRCGEALVPSGLVAQVGGSSVETARVGGVDGSGGGCWEGGFVGLGASSSSVDGKNSVVASSCARLADCARLGEAIFLHEQQVTSGGRDLIRRSE